MLDPTGVGPQPGTITLYALDGWDPSKPTPIGNENFDVFLALNGDSSSKTRYLHDDQTSGLVARIDISGGTQTPEWILTDHLGSVRDVVNNSGTVVDAVQYGAFGVISAETSASNRGDFSYAAGWNVFEIGLIEFDARFLDVTTSRWMSEDPIQDGNNWYQYAGNNPVTNTDPSGLERVDVADGNNVYWVIQSHGWVYNSDVRRVRIGYTSGSEVHILNEFGGGTVALATLQSSVSNYWNVAADMSGAAATQQDGTIRAVLDGVVIHQRAITTPSPMAQIASAVGDAYLDAQSSGLNALPFGNPIEAVRTGDARNLIPGYTLIDGLQRGVNQDFDFYHDQLHVDPIWAAVMAAGQRIPIVGDEVNVFELWDQKSLRSGDFGHPLGILDNVGRAAPIVADVAGLGAMGLEAFGTNPELSLELEGAAPIRQAPEGFAEFIDTPENLPGSGELPAPAEVAPVSRTASQEISSLGQLKGKSAAEVTAKLTAEGYKPTTGNNGGTIWTKGAGDGNTAAVRVDPAMVRAKPRGFADEVPHIHKEIVPTNNVTNGNYSPRHAITLNDLGVPSADPRQTHIPGGH